MSVLKSIAKRRVRRKHRVRRRIRGTAERPRLTVFRSRQNIYAQLIDDDTGRTLVSASSQDKELRGAMKYGGNVAAAKAVGALLGQRAVAASLSLACFDRGAYRYHGRVAALADGAREAGLQF